MREPGWPALRAGAPIFVFLFNLLGYNLRHSHVYWAWPPLMGRILGSPGNHQIHHSSEARHLDKNFGGVFIIWDRLFGTYLAPEPVLATGVHGRDSAPGLLGAHLEPLVYLWVRLRRVKSGWRKLKMLLIG